MEKLLHVTKFLEHVYHNYQQAVIKIPCGLGKSVHAITHMVAFAAPENRFVLVIRDRFTLLEVSQDLSSFGITAGIYVGFNQSECHELTDKKYTYELCLRGHKDSKCRSCTKRGECRFYQSDSAFEHDVVLITHESFLIQCEKGRSFSDRTIIIDEALSVFASEDFKVSEFVQLRHLLRGSGFPAIRDLLTELFPFINIKSNGTFRKSYYIEEMQEVKLIRLSERITPEILQTLFRFSFTRGCPDMYHELFFRFLLFIRTAAQCGASVAVTTSVDNKLILKKQRVDFRYFCQYKRLFILDASAGFSQVGLPDNMPILTCSNLDEYCTGRVRIHVVVGNPTKSRRKKNMEAAMELYSQFIEDVEDNEKLLLSYNKDKYLHDKVSEDLCSTSEILTSGSGYLRGTNLYQDCIIAFFASTGWFTSVEDCALNIALQEQQSIMWERFMKLSGYTQVPRVDCTGRYCDPAMQRMFMTNCIDKLYQAVYRTAIRKGKDVDIFMPVPSLDWLIPLQQLMPCEVVAAKGSSVRRGESFTGMSQLINLPAGYIMSKQEAAELCGYPTWKQAKRTLSNILTELFDFREKHLIRKEVHHKR